MERNFRLVWLSDSHLEFVRDEREIRRFCQGIRRQRPGAIVITGDIGVANNVHLHLTTLAKLIGRPVYYILGNHDYYHSGFNEVKLRVDGLNDKLIVRLDRGAGAVIPIGNNAVLIGVGGWGDGRAGLGEATSLRLNDQLLISDFHGLNKADCFALLQQLGDQSAEFFLRLAPSAFEQADHVVLATHVPPFAEASRYESGPSEPPYLPYFVNVALGNAILEMAQKYPRKQMTVLAGHTHFPAEYDPLPNLKVTVAGARYGFPRIAGILDFPKG